ncbi:MAG: class II glutamine amidotransferase [Candidatus Dormibacteria bacterium]
MCELLLATWPQPRPINHVLEWAESLERHGLGGYGWGVAWRERGLVFSHRHPGLLRDDLTGRRGLSGVASTHFMIHLRRPSQLSTIALADTQPFLADDGSYAFEHNGRLDRSEEVRGRFEGSLHGRADSEVGFRLFGALRQAGLSAAAALAAVHQQLGGTANLCYLPSTGPALAYAGAPANQMWRFRIAGAEVISTALHSADEAVFDLCFHDAVDRKMIAEGAIEQLDELPVGA